MDKKTFNTVLASVMAGAMTIGVATYANKKAESKGKKGAATEQKAGAEHKCGEGKCSNKEGAKKEGAAAEEHKE